MALTSSLGGDFGSNTRLVFRTSGPAPVLGKALPSVPKNRIIQSFHAVLGDPWAQRKTIRKGLDSGGCTQNLLASAAGTALRFPPLGEHEAAPEPANGEGAELRGKNAGNSFSGDPAPLQSPADVARVLCAREVFYLLCRGVCPPLVTGTVTHEEKRAGTQPLHHPQLCSSRSSPQLSPRTS